MTRIAAQVLITIDEKGTYRAELVRQGSPLRQKLELRPGLWEQELRDTLETASVFNRANHIENERIAEQNKRQSAANRANKLSREIFDHVASHHSLKLAKRVVPKLAASVKIKPSKSGGFEIEVDGEPLAAPNGIKTRLATASGAAQVARENGYVVGRRDAARRVDPVSYDDL